MSGISQKNFNPYNTYQDHGLGKRYPAFKSVRNSLLVNIPPSNVNLQTPPSDTVRFSTKKEPEFSQQKDGLSNATKCGIGLGLTGLAALACLAIKKKAPTKQINQLAENLNVLKKSTLPENIPMQNFKTKEDAFNFIKKTLKIEKYDENLSLDALNDSINSIIKISNKHKGKLYMPIDFKFIQAEDKMIASITSDIKNSNLGTLQINSSLYNHTELDKLLKNWDKYLFTQKGNPLFLFKEGKLISNSSFNGLTIRPDKEFSNLLEKFYNKEAMTLKEKQNLLLSVHNMLDKAALTVDAPNVILSKIQKLYPEFLKEQGLSINLKNFAEKSIKEQSAELSKILEKLELKKKIVEVNAGIKTIEDSIIHEFGHLQDLGFNKKMFMNTDDFARRFSRKKHFEDVILKNNPNFKLPSILTDSIEANTAGKVSSYATEGIGEFIAETYAKLIKDIKLDDDVLALYKKYSGPAIA